MSLHSLKIGCISLSLSLLTLRLYPLSISLSFRKRFVGAFFPQITHISNICTAYANIVSNNKIFCMILIFVYSDPQQFIKYAYQSSLLSLRKTFPFLKISDFMNLVFWHFNPNYIFNTLFTFTTLQYANKSKKPYSCKKSQWIVWILVFYCLYYSVKVTVLYTTVWLTLLLKKSIKIKIASDNSSFYLFYW